VKVTSEMSLIDGCTLEWQSSVLDLVRQRSSVRGEQVSVRHMRLLGNQGVLVFMSDETVFEYEPRSRLWRQSLMNPQGAELLLKAQSQQSSEPRRMPNQLRDLSAVISQLETTSIARDGDVEMSTEKDVIGDALSLHVRVNELQEAVQMYERLQMKSEFLYSMRMYTLSLLQVGDMLRTKELLNEYKFLFTWEEERAFEIA
jgi:hypothetical protein